MRTWTSINIGSGKSGLVFNKPDLIYTNGSVYKNENIEVVTTKDC